MNSITGLAYLVIGCAMILLFRTRRRALGSLTPDLLPELSREQFAELRVLLKTAYERTLYLGVLFLPLAWVTLRDGDRISTLFFLILIGLLFLSNIPPRNRIMRLLESRGLSMADLADRGIQV